MDSIAAVVNLHAEGTAAVPSLISAWRACLRARETGLQVELVLVLDDADQPTSDLADQWANNYGATLLSTSAGDLGMARNHAATSLDATWLAYLDGDDLWGEDWLVAAHAIASTTPLDPPVVFHPTVNIIFGDHHSLLHHIDSTSIAFRWARFHLHNAWTALSFVRRQTVVDLPYPANDLANGFGFEDWSWNMAVLDAGGQHRVVPDTCHFIKRVDDGSLLGRSQHALRTPYPGTGVTPERRAEPAIAGGAVDAHTHVQAPVELSERILSQVGLASTIEPAVAKTLTSAGSPSALPQNFNTHNTAPQLALEELWGLRVAAASISEICDRSVLLASLEVDERTMVVAEFLRTERARGRSVGESPFIAEASAKYSQLASAP